MKKSKKSKKPELKQKRFARFKVDANGYGFVVWQCPYCREFWAENSLQKLPTNRCPNCRKPFAKWSKELEVKLSAELVKMEDNIKTWRCPHGDCKGEWQSYATISRCPHCEGQLAS